MLWMARARTGCRTCGAIAACGERPAVHERPMGQWGCRLKTSSTPPLACAVRHAPVHSTASHERHCLVMDVPLPLHLHREPSSAPAAGPSPAPIPVPTPAPAPVAAARSAAYAAANGTAAAAGGTASTSASGAGGGGGGIWGHAAPPPSPVGQPSDYWARVEKALDERLAGGTASAFVTRVRRVVTGALLKRHAGQAGGGGRHTMSIKDLAILTKKEFPEVGATH